MNCVTSIILRLSRKLVVEVNRKTTEQDERMPAKTEVSAGIRERRISGMKSYVCRVNLPRLVYLLLLLLSTATATHFAQRCRLHHTPVVAIAFDNVTGRYALLDYNVSNISSLIPASRQLRSGSGFPAIHVDGSRKKKHHNSSSNIYVRKCTCAPTTPSQYSYYCPYEKSTCGIPEDSADSIGCYAESTKLHMLRHVW